MPQGQRPQRVGEEIRHELASMLSRDAQDPGIGFVTLTRVTVSPDLQLARVYYTQLGDERARRETKRALDRALPFLRRGIGSRLRLRRVPEIQFFFDESIVNHDRIEKILLDLQQERDARESAESATAPVEPAESTATGPQPSGPPDGKPEQPS